MSASIAGSEVDDDGDFAEAHEINVTPFIDVMLVLLIIFMVAAPLSTVDLPIDLPTSSATPTEEAGQADLCQHQAGSDGRDRRDPGQAGRSGPFARCRAGREQGPLHLPARRPRRCLMAN